MAAGRTEDDGLFVERQVRQLLDVVQVVLLALLEALEQLLEVVLFPPEVHTGSESSQARKEDQVLEIVRPRHN